MEIKWKELKKPWLGKYAGITLIPYVFIYIANKTKKQITILKNHESIHAAQVTDQQDKNGKILGWIVWYGKYIGYWLKGVLGGFFSLKGKSSRQAYLDIPYEKEAYANETNLNYLKTREKDSWKKYK
jgi:hypothetical protein